MPLRTFWDAAAINQISAAGVWTINQIQTHLVILHLTFLNNNHKKDFLHSVAPLLHNLCLNMFSWMWATFLKISQNQYYHIINVH